MKKLLTVFLAVTLFTASIHAEEKVIENEKVSFTVSDEMVAKFIVKTVKEKEALEEANEELIAINRDSEINFKKLEKHANMSYPILMVWSAGFTLLAVHTYKASQGDWTF